MENNEVKKLLSEIGRKGVEYCLNKGTEIEKMRGISFPNAPNKPDRHNFYQYPKNALKVIPIILKKKSSPGFYRIIRKRGFIRYKKLYYLYDKNLGLIRLDILIVKDLPKHEKINKTNISHKRIDFDSGPELSSKGKLICFLGPNGSGKTTGMNIAFNILEGFPIRKIPMYFSTGQHTAMYRFFSRIKNLARIYYLMSKGNTVLTDRYIFLSFRKRNPVVRKLVRFLSPKPDAVFIMKADYKTISKRRKIHLQPKAEVEDYYRLFSEIKNAVWIDTLSPIKDNAGIIMERILKLYDEVKDE